MRLGVILLLVGLCGSNEHYNIQALGRYSVSVSFSSIDQKVSCPG